MSNSVIEVILEIYIFIAADWLLLYCVAEKMRGTSFHIFVDYFINTHNKLTLSVGDRLSQKNPQNI